MITLIRFKQDSDHQCSLLSGGAESSISIWDLESIGSSSKEHIYHPLGSVEKYR